MHIVSNFDALRPADKLLGLDLVNGWIVKKRIDKHPVGTGSNFSVGYIVENPYGQQAFLKAVDFSRALAEKDPARELQKLTETFNFERDLLEKCRKKNLNRVVRALEEGTVEIDGLPVPYLIFELA